MKMKRFFKVTGTAAVLTMMMVGTAFAAGNKGRKEYREAVCQMEQEFAVSELEDVQKKNEAYALWYIDLSENYRSSESELAPEDAEKWEQAKALREEIRKIQIGEEADAEEKTAGAKEARMNMATENGEKVKQNSEVKELRAKMKALADNGEFEDTLKLYEEILEMKNERAAKAAEVNKLWEQIAELLNK